MNYLEDNINTLQKSNPELAQKVINCLHSTPLPVCEKDEQGFLNFKININGQAQWFYNDQLGQSINRCLDHIKNQERPEVVVFKGLGLGHHLHAYLQKPHQLNRFIVIIEPSIEIFSLCLSSADLTNLLAHPNICWVVAPDKKNLLEVLVNACNKDGLAQCLHHSVFVDWEYSHALLSPIMEAWGQFLYFVRIESQTLPIDAYIGLMFFFDNWTNTSQTQLLGEFKDIYKDKPGIVIGTGPSLQFSLEHLKNIENQAVLFAVDSACKILQDNNVNYHMTGTLERVEATASLFEGVNTKDKTLFCTPIIPPKTYQSFKGPTVHLARSNHFLPWVFPENPADLGGMTSVTHLGLYVLWHMGCRPIYLVGQDLSFDPKTQMDHIDGYHEELMADVDNKKRVGWDLITVSGHTGEDRQTNNIWYQFGQLTSLMIDRKKIECYNIIPQDYGIKIDHAPQKEPDEIFNNWNQQPIDLSKLSNIHELFDDEMKKAYSEQMAKIGTQTKEWLINQINQWKQSSQSIFEFYLENPPQNIAPDNLAKYNSFFRQLESDSNQLGSHPFFANMFRLIIQEVHLALIEASNTLLAQSDSSPDVLEKKIAIPLAWYGEMIAMGEMVLARLEEL